MECQSTQLWERFALLNLEQLLGAGGRGWDLCSEYVQEKQCVRKRNLALRTRGQKALQWYKKDLSRKMRTK